MKLFISKEVVNNIGGDIILERIDENHTVLKVFNIKELADGKKEITPFQFRLPINQDVIKTAKGEILLDIAGVKVNKNKDKVESSKENSLYLMFYSKDEIPAEIYIPTEMKDNIKLLYKVRGRGVFYLLHANVLPHQDNVKIYLAYEVDNLIQRRISFKVTEENEIKYQKVNKYYYLDRYTKELYLPLSIMGGIPI